jgi:endonuclease/exonuclease/phosphatase family metal-dependent hydrolase
MRKFVKLSLVLVGLPAAILLFLILYATITDFRPPEKEIVFKSDASFEILADTAVYRLLIWNIGYGGLDKQMDFFYDGGKRVRTPVAQFKQNLSGIEKFIAGAELFDFVLLQEVDVSSKRSYHFNEVRKFTENWGGGYTCYGKNYDVFFVPVPFQDPMGAVNSGVLSHSHFKPMEVSRNSFPGHYGWPKRLFMLDRCFLVMRFPLTNGKQLLVINTHNEAYDNGSIRDQQMAYLKKFLLTEYEAGNFLVVAGDWNQCPPDFKPRFTGDVFDTIDYKRIESDLPSGWSWVYDSTIPSNRRVDIAYVKGKTRTTVIDFFLLSPNLHSTGCRTTDLGFACSDHQPVQINISFFNPQKTIP